MKQSALCFVLPLQALFLIDPGTFLGSSELLAGRDILFQLTQQPAGFDSWRPYSNPSRLITVGMNKGEVLAVAGKPDYEESYYQSGRARLIRISDWYYVRLGFNAETTLLKFVEESLVSITSTPTR